jgi:hypothetical protein
MSGNAVTTWILAPVPFAISIARRRPARAGGEPSVPTTIARIVTPPPLIDARGGLR